MDLNAPVLECLKCTQDTWHSRHLSTRVLKGHLRTRALKGHLGT